MRKKFLSHFISQEPYIIWLSFVVHKGKMMVSSGFFIIFSKFWFFRLLVGYKEKKWPKMTKKSVCHAPYSRNHTSYDHLWLHKCEMISPCMFFFCFLNLDFLGQRANGLALTDEKLCHDLYSRTIHHMVFIYGIVKWGRKQPLKNLGELKIWPL